MKKKISLIFFMLVLAVSFLAVGCKAPADLGSKVEKWNNLQSIGGNAQNLLRIKASEYAIDWWVITDENGIVIEDYEVYEVNGNEVSDEPIDRPVKIAEGTTVELKFNFEKNTDVVLWIAQDERVPKKSKNEDGTKLEPGSKDYRGRIPVGPNQGYIAEDKSYREEVSPVGVLSLTCNETGSVPEKQVKKINGVDCYGGRWSGDYKITELWPLVQENAQWVAKEDLKFMLDQYEATVEESETIKVIYPAGNTVFAMKQPARFTDKDDQDIMNNQKDWYWCFIFDNEHFKNLGDFSSFPAHKETEVFSSKCTYKFVLSENAVKSALGATYIIDESDIVDGSDEK